MILKRRSPRAPCQRPVQSISEKIQLKQFLQISTNISSKSLFYQFRQELMDCLQHNLLSLASEYQPVLRAGPFSLGSGSGFRLRLLVNKGAFRICFQICMRLKQALQALVILPSQTFQRKIKRFKTKVCLRFDELLQSK